MNQVFIRVFWTDKLHTINDGNQTSRDTLFEGLFEQTKLSGGGFGRQTRSLLERRYQYTVP